MSKRRLIPGIVLSACLAAGGASAQAPAAASRVVPGLGLPESAAVGADGRVYVTACGVYEQYGDGIIAVVEGDRVRPLATGLNDPHGLDVWDGALYAADNRGQLWRVGPDGRVKLIADSTKFPRKITNFNDIEIDAAGTLYVSDSGDWEGKGGGAVYRVTRDGAITALLTDDENEALVSPNGLLMDGPDALLVLDYVTGDLHRLDLKTKAFTKVNGGFGAGDGLARDADGRLYVSDYKDGRVFVLDRPDGEPRLVVEGLESAADIALAPDGKHLLVPDMDAGRLAFVPLPDAAPSPD